MAWPNGRYVCVYKTSVSKEEIPISTIHQCPIQHCSLLLIASNRLMQDKVGWPWLPIRTGSDWPKHICPSRVYTSLTGSWRNRSAGTRTHVQPPAAYFSDHLAAHNLLSPGAGGHSQISSPGEAACLCCADAMISVDVLMILIMPLHGARATVAGVSCSNRETNQL